jgi:peptidoglycan/xylan/chitin deacetylase (PgdA/CDA1 family)
MVAPSVLQRDSRRAARAIARAIGVPVAVALERVLRLSQLRAGVALAYHSVAEQGGNPQTELVPPHSLRLFEAELRHLARRYRLVRAAELPEAVASRRRSQRFPVAVTFDDDLACHVRQALPVLERLGVSATFFLSGASLDAPFSFWWERLQRAYARGEPQVHTLVEDLPAGAELRPPLSIHEVGRAVEALDPERRDAFAEGLLEAAGPDPADTGLRSSDLRTLVEAGMEIGFHTRRHDGLPALSDGALAHAMRDGRRELETITGSSITVIGYPHGRADGRVASAARAAGFRVGFTTKEAAVRPSSNPLLLGRINPSYRSLGHFALQLVLTLLSRR